MFNDREWSSSKDTEFSEQRPKEAFDQAVCAYTNQQLARRYVGEHGLETLPDPSNVIWLPSNALNIPHAAEFTKLLLRLVAEGEQDQAELLLKANSNLVLATGTVTDLAGRTFKKITALQYACWALDRHMWTMILKYMPEEQAVAQLRVTGSWVTTHGLHAGVSGGPLETLINRLGEYVSKQHNSFFSQDTYWQKQVAGAQLLLPAHVIHEYCRPDRSFHPTPDFKELVLPRTRNIDEGEWYTAKYNGGQLGQKYGVRRGCLSIARACVCSLYSGQDRVSIARLNQVRVRELHDLHTRFGVQQVASREQRVVLN